MAITGIAGPGRRNGREAGGGRSAGASGQRRAAESRARCVCPATGRTSGTARRRWRCTCCGACCPKRRPRGHRAARKNNVSGPRARMFLALDLPDGRARGARRWRDAILSSRSDVRPVRPEALHVTLVFLGWQDESAAGRIAEAAFGALPGGPPPRLRHRRQAGPAPERAPVRARPRRRGRPRDRVAGRHVGRARGGRLVPPEKRPFWPHITLARVKRGERRVPPPPARAAPARRAFEARVLTLYRSTLRPQGALYEPLARTVAGDALDPASGARR